MRKQLLNPITARRLVRLSQLNSGNRPATSNQRLDFSADGRWLVSMPQRGHGRLRWWDLSEGEAAPMVDIPLVSGSAAVLSSSRGTVLSATYSGLLQEWSIRTGELMRQARLVKGVSGLTLSADEKNLLVVNGDGLAWIWDVMRWDSKRTLEVRTSLLYGGALSPDGRLAAAGAGYMGQTDPGCIIVWEVDTGAVVGQIPVDAFYAWCVAFHPTLPLLVAGAPADDLYVVDLLKWKVVRRLESLGSESMSFSPDGELLVAGGTGFSVLSFYDGSRLYNHQDDNDEQSSSAILSPDGSLIAWGEGDGNVGLWSVPRE